MLYCFVLNSMCPVYHNKVHCIILVLHSRAAESKLYVDIEEGCSPIVYRDEYNIHLLGMEKLHPFDACKWGNVVKVSYQ